MNVRTRSAALSGVQRYVQEMYAELRDRIVTIAPRTSLRGSIGHLWEQCVLPRIVANRLLWSPGNTGPLEVANQVVTIHDLAPLDHPEWFSSLFSRWYQFLIPRLVVRVRHVLTVSNFSKTRLVQLFGIDDSRVTVIPNGVSSRFSPRLAEEIDNTRELLGLDASRYILSLGSIEPRKNLGRLLQAWSRCCERLDSDIQLVVAGSRGPISVFGDAGVTSLPARVRFTGFVPDHALPALYSGALAFVYPSLYEGFGLPVLEAMACGAVPIVSRGTALVEVCDTAGISIDPCDIGELGDALVTICREDGLRTRLREAAILRSARFSWQEAARRSLKVLNCFSA